MEAGFRDKTLCRRTDEIIGQCFAVVRLCIVVKVIRKFVMILFQSNVESVVSACKLLLLLLLVALV